MQRMKSILIVTGIFSPDIGGPASYARTLAQKNYQKIIRLKLLAYSSVRKHEQDKSYPFVVKGFGKNIWVFRHVVYF